MGCHVLSRAVPRVYPPASWPRLNKAKFARNRVAKRCEVRKSEHQTRTRGSGWSRVLLPRHRQVLDPTGLLAHRLRVERHQLENLVRHGGGDRQAKLLGDGGED